MQQGDRETGRREDGKTGRLYKLKSTSHVLYAHKKDEIEANKLEKGELDTTNTNNLLQIKTCGARVLACIHMLLLLRDCFYCL